ncbi:MAG: LamG-like jellyroll fold domain-containing protein [Planctomycetota bacterium]
MISFSFVAVSGLFSGVGAADELTKGLVFLAPFDGGFDAVVGVDRVLCTAEDLKRQVISPGNLRKDVQIVAGAGRHGDSLRFTDGGATQVTMFRGSNTGYRSRNWSGTVSMWLRLSPDEDLKPGYCDPLQITDKEWNNAAFFVDFDKDLPRVFRLGVFSDFRTWNPKDTPWEQIAVGDRPMVPVSHPPFRRSEWTHVAWTFSDVNSGGADGTAELYINGRSMGALMCPMTFSWQLDKTAIMLGIAYTGDIDELSMYDRALSHREVNTLYRLPKGLTPLVNPASGK